MFIIILLPFQGGPYHNTLEGVLGAYVIYRPDIGYVSINSWLKFDNILKFTYYNVFFFFVM